MIFRADTAGPASWLIRQKSPQVIAKLMSYAITDIGISAITVAEPQFGFMRQSTKPSQNQQAPDLFVLPLTIL